VFENGLLRRIFRIKGRKVRGAWQRVHEEGLYDL
jgi:hypothetical protein